MNIPDIIGWVGNVFFIWGVYALGKKNIKGFYSNAFGNFMYVVQAYLLGIPSLFWLSWGLIVLNIKGIIEWRKESYESKKILIDTHSRAVADLYDDKERTEDE